VDYYIETTDILLSYDTDIDFEHDDLMLTSGNELLKRRVFKLLISEFRDWPFEPNIGANPNVFMGEHNTRETAKSLTEFLETRIQPYINPAFLSVRVVPVDYDSIKIYLDLYVDGIVAGIMPFTMDFVNGLQYTDYDERVDTVISNSVTKMNTINDVNKPNKYLDRLRQR